jgi:integrase
MRAHGDGSATLDRRSKVWNFYWWEAGKRHGRKIGTLSQYPTKTAAWKAAKEFRDAVETKQTIVPDSKPTAPTVSILVEQYRVEKMPTRIDTRRSYDVWLRKYIVPKWGQCVLPELQARPVELWLASLTLAPKSRAHIRGLVSVLWDFAMWSGSVPVQRNPMELVTVKIASKRTRQPRRLTVAEFQSFLQHLREPFNIIALLCVCFGLRISECLALRWDDGDWLGARLTVERGIVRGEIGDTKTTGSRKQLTIDAVLLETLKVWKQTTQFSGADDWMFASPVKLGQLPWSYPQILRVFQRAATAAGIGMLGTHTMRHTFRSWLDSVGTPVGLQQKRMRHASITTTMDHYGEPSKDEMSQAHGKVVGLALNGR